MLIKTIYQDLGQLMLSINTKVIIVGAGKDGMPIIMDTK